MSSFPRTPKLTRAGIVLMSPDGNVLREIPLQYNPEKLTRTLQAQFVEPDGQNRSDPARLSGPPIETIKLEAIVDAADQLEQPDRNQDTVQHGIQPLLAALELTIYPHSTKLEQSKSASNTSAIEVFVTEAPLTVFVWGKSRIVPVRITDFAVTEEFFDPELNPIRAVVSLGMRVLSVTDLGFQHVGSNLYMVYQKQKEALAAKVGSQIGQLSLRGAPV